MKTLACLILLCAGLWLPAAAPAGSLPADLARGHRLFHDPTLGGGSSGKSCNTCHEHGRDLGPDLAERRWFTVMGIEMHDLAEVINFCIEVTLRGADIAPSGRQMADLQEFVIWLGRHPDGQTADNP